MCSDAAASVIDGRHFLNRPALSVVINLISAEIIYFHEIDEFNTKFVSSGCITSQFLSSDVKFSYAVPILKHVSQPEEALKSSMPSISKKVLAFFLGPLTGHPIVRCWLNHSSMAASNASYANLFLAFRLDNPLMQSELLEKIIKSSFVLAKSHMV